MVITQEEWALINKTLGAVCGTHKKLFYDYLDTNQVLRQYMRSMRQNAQKNAQSPLHVLYHFSCNQLIAKIECVTDAIVNFKNFFKMRKRGFK